MKVCVNGLLSEMISDETGVNQGGPNSPDMFIDFLSDLRNYLNEKCGIVVNDDILLHLLWADDLIIVANSAADLQKSLDNLAHYCSLWQLILNVLKTKVLIFGQSAKKHGDICTAFKFNGNVIDITDQYKYLGCIFKSKYNVFKEHVNTTVTKATRATYKVQSYCTALGTPPPALAIKLFNSIVMPVIEYGSEIWSAGNNIDVLDTFQVKFFKRVLKVRPQTPTLAVLGEVGEYPVSIKVDLRVIKYWLRLVNMPSDHIARKMFVLLQSLDNMGFPTWFTNLKKVLEKYGLEDLIHNNSVPMTQYRHIKQHVYDVFEEKFITMVTDSQRCPKLRTYNQFKFNFGYETYLSLQIPKYRVSLSRLRISSHHLEIERGRYTIPKTPAELRICKQCNEQLVENEQHFVTTCKKHTLLREELYSVAHSNIPNFNGLSAHEKFLKLLSSEDGVVICALAKFTYHAFKQRT